MAEIKVILSERETQKIIEALTFQSMREKRASEKKAYKELADFFYNAKIQAIKESKEK